MTDLLPYSATLLLEGPDTIELLDRTLTCAIGNLETGASRPGALLTPQGKIIADFLLTRTEGGCALTVHPEAIDALEKRLKLFRLRAKVDISREDGSPADIDHAARIAAGQPCFGHDFADADVFPTDVNLDLFGGVDYKKGCFVGQEVVSRMYRRGKIRKRTVVLNGNNLETGMDVRAGNKLLGKITSASESNALAILRIDNLAKAFEAVTDIEAGGKAVSVVRPDWLNEEITALTAGEDA
ncbi:MAG: folate-binding protein [Pseudomonadota bacterium]